VIWELSARLRDGPGFSDDRLGLLSRKTTLRASRVFVDGPDWVRFWAGDRQKTR